MAEPTTVRERSGSGDTPTAFNAAVSAITAAFGAPPRRRIYLFTRDHAGDDGVTASEVAAEVGVHPNVARHHLDKLAAGGYVEVAVRTVVSERRAGRPAADHQRPLPVRHGRQRPPGDLRRRPWAGARDAQLALPRR